MRISKHLQSIKGHFRKQHSSSIFIVDIMHTHLAGEWETKYPCAVMIHDCLKLEIKFLEFSHGTADSRQ